MRLGEQLDKGSLRNMITQGQKKQNKRLHKRAMRKQAKNINNESPQHNRYNGWAV